MDRNKVVLHVDDDPSQLRIVSALLEKHGYTVESTSDPNDALARLSTSGARIAILDVDMPGKNGLSLLQEIKASDGGIQVIMLTGLIDMNTALRSMRWGAEACIFKPLTDPSRLLEAIEAASAKIDRWWRAVTELTNERKSLREPQVSTSERP